MELRGLERELLRRAREHNNERSTRATVAIGVGIICTALTAGLTYASCWFVLKQANIAFAGIDLELWLTGVVIGVLFIEAAWNRNPFAGLRPLGSSELSMTGDIAHAYGGVRPHERGDHVAAGMHEIVIGGPRSIMEGIGLLIGGLPSSGAAAREGAEALVTMARGTPAEITHRDAGRLLVGLRLARPSDDPERPVYFGTNRAAFVVREHAGRG